MNPQSSKLPWAIGVAVVVLAAVLIYWYAVLRKASPEPASQSNGGTAGGSAEQTGTLGADIYEKAQNPVADKLPDTSAGVPNPIGNAYKNPFQ